MVSMTEVPQEHRYKVRGIFTEFLRTVTAFSVVAYSGWCLQVRIILFSNAQADWQTLRQVCYQRFINSCCRNEAMYDQPGKVLRISERDIIRCRVVRVARSRHKWSSR